MSQLLERFLAHGNDARTAVVGDAGQISYAGLVRRARAVAASLQGLDDARVALLIGPGADFLAAFYGVLLAGRCVVVLTPLHPVAEIRYYCADAAIRTVITSQALAGTAAQLEGVDVLRVEELVMTTIARLPVPVAEAAPAVMLYTSGTTGKPKGAILTHENLGIQQQLVGEAWGFSASDTLLHTLPLHHMHGLAIALLTAIGAGATVRMRAFDANAVWSEMEHATVFMGVPSMYHRLFGALDAAGAEADLGRHAKQLRLATSGSAALPVTLAERWRELTGKIPLERFGMTEIGVGITNTLAGPRHAGHVGWPLPTVETRIVGEDGKDAETGELWIRGPSVFVGYHEKPAETAAAFVDGWFRTGDTVTRGEDIEGRPFKILGRTSVDILKSGGYKLSALEIEEVLRRHPDVDDVAVVGVPDEAWGERVVACVQTHRPCEAEALRAFVKEHLAPYKVPKQVLFFDKLPRNALGKVVKPDLVKALASA